MLEENKSPISASFYRGIITVALIISGWIFVEGRIKNTFNDALAPIKEDIKSVKDEVKEVKSTVAILKPTVELNDYRVNLHEQAFREFIKPDDISRKRQK